MADEPRIGWEQSIERNRLDAGLTIVLDMLRLLAQSADATQHVNTDVLSAFMTEIRMAEGYLVDAQIALTGVRRG